MNNVRSDSDRLATRIHCLARNLEQLCRMLVPALALFGAKMESERGGQGHRTLKLSQYAEKECKRNAEETSGRDGRICPMIPSSVSCYAHWISQDHEFKGDGSLIQLSPLSITLMSLHSLTTRAEPSPILAKR